MKNEQPQTLEDALAVIERLRREVRRLNNAMRHLRSKRNG